MLRILFPVTVLLLLLSGCSDRHQPEVRRGVFVKAYGPAKTMGAQAAAFHKFVESLQVKISP